MRITAMWPLALALSLAPIACSPLGRPGDRIQLGDVFSRNRPFTWCSARNPDQGIVTSRCTSIEPGTHEYAVVWALLDGAPVTLISRPSPMGFYLPAEAHSVRRLTPQPGREYGVLSQGPALMALDWRGGVALQPAEVKSATPVRWEPQFRLLHFLDDLIKRAEERPPKPGRDDV